MAAKNLAAIQQLSDRATSLESRNKRRLANDKLSADRLYGFGTAFVTSALAGYLDGRFDLTDEEIGDGTNVLGIPVMPVAAGLLAVGGMAIGGKVGSMMAYGGLGTGCGWAYSRASAKGMAADAKRRG